MKYKTSEIAAITGSILTGNPDTEVSDIAFDSRKIFAAANVAFIAINTTKNSGEKYIRSAIEKGVKIIISEHEPLPDSDVTWIKTDNCVRFLQILAHHHLQNLPNLLTFGITGSNGKTVVKEWLFQSVWHDYLTVKSPKSYNSQIGLPLSVLQAEERHQLGIFEVGISMPGEMELQQQVFSPKIGILTHIGTAHSVNFKNEEELISEKLKLFKDTAVIVFNGDNPLVVKLVNKMYSDRKLISFGLEEHNDFHIRSDFRTDKTVHIIAGDDELLIDIQQRDEATLTNALAVIACLYFLGREKHEITAKINALKAVEMRLESVIGNKSNLIINDSFNLDLDSLKIALQSSMEYRKPKNVLVISDFMEISDFDENLYPTVAKMVNAYDFTEIILVGENIAGYRSLFNKPVTAFNDTIELIDSQYLNRFEDSLILLKGARKFAFEKIKNQLELQKHDTVLEVNLNAILHNITAHRAKLDPSTKIMAMVKAHAYGLGSIEIAEFLQLNHIDYLGVAYADEGVELRNHGITVPIIVMNPEQHSYDAIIDYGLEPEIYSLRVLELFTTRLEDRGVLDQYPVHIKLETGMHRLGFKDAEIEQLIAEIKKKNILVKSIFSHLSSSDIPSEKDYTWKQVTMFEEISSKLISGLGYQPVRHILNSSGIANYPEFQYDMVRIGVGMVGVSASADLKKRLLPAVQFKTVVSQVSRLETGETVGYGRNFEASSERLIATVPVGYADGIPRLIGKGKGKVSIQNKLVPIVGNICMDMMMLDVTGLSVAEGDEVIIFNGTPTLEEFAEYCQTIPYEVLTSISRRVKRVYIKS